MRLRKVPGWEYGSERAILFVECYLKNNYADADSLIEEMIVIEKNDIAVVLYPSLQTVDVFDISVGVLINPDV